MRVLVTGAAGFLGWHTRLRLHARTDHEVRVVTRDTWSSLPELVAGCDAVIHLAGVIRGAPEDVRDGSVHLAEELGAALTEASPGVRVVYANSIHTGNGTPYGTGKHKAAEVLSAAAASRHGDFVDVVLPNLFGEHCRPHYNSFVATFVDAVVHDASPEVRAATVPLLHVQQAAEALVGALDSGPGLVLPRGESHDVPEVWGQLQEMHTSYRHGEVPDLSSPFRVDLFNSYRAALFPDHYPLFLTPHTDVRGTFVETVRCRGGEGQTSFSTTAPGVTRGEHYHLRKVERFAVLSGSATMALRRMFTDEVVEFAVSGDQPTAVDMPVGWAHDITNTGDDILLTQFWSHELFRPEDPDTYPEKVRLATVRAD